MKDSLDITIAFFNFANDKNNYYHMLDKYGLEKTWDQILSWLKKYPLDDFNNKIVQLDDIGKLYESGLAHLNKIQKRDAGKYYTPMDVSKTMAHFFVENYNGGPIADVGCGCGNLITTVFDEIINVYSQTELKKIIDNRQIYLYDLDKLAIKICIARLEKKFGISLNEKVNIINDDFLLKRNTLADDINVISNPPYHVIKKNLIDVKWDDLPAFYEVRNLYVAFFEKIIKKAKMAVIVSPQSFIAGKKFSLFRKKLQSNYNGEIFSFDNVPGTLFDGKKEGIFNSNFSNAIRAAITVIRRNDDKKLGFRLTHLIRFKSTQRESILNVNFLKSKLGKRYQDLFVPLKSFVELEEFAHNIIDRPHIKLSDLIENDKTMQDDSLAIWVSNSARYFTVASSTELNRSGKYKIYAKNRKYFVLLYALFNSSYCYMWWRFLDGGILIPKWLIYEIPIPLELINLNGTEKILSDKVSEIIMQEGNFKHYKNNANKLQESIKFPNKVKEELNKVLFPKIDFSLLHNNMEAIHEE